MAWRIARAVLLVCWVVGRASAQQPPATQPSADDRTSPTLITLHVKDADPQVVFQDISRQADVPIEASFESIWGKLTGKLTIDADRQPFWVVMLKACRQAGLRPQRHDWKITLSQDSNGWNNHPMAVKDGYVLVVESIEHAHGLDYSKSDEAKTTFKIDFSCLVDPKFRTIQNSGLMLTEAIDEKGKSLKPFSQPARWSSWHYPDRIWKMSANLDYTPSGGRRITSLKGTTGFLTVARLERWKLDEVLKIRNVQKKTPLCTYTVNYVTQKKPEEYEVGVTLEFRHLVLGFPTKALTDWSLIGESLDIVDAAGRKWPYGAGGMNIPDLLHVEYTMPLRMTYFNGELVGERVGEPVRLIWDLPLELEETKVSFEFKDLPIP